jgi:capsule biosynthesis phosphatase
MKKSKLPHQQNGSIVIDLDNTLTIETNASYAEKIPNLQVIEACHKYHNLGYKIVVHTSRNMQTYKGNIDSIMKFTYPTIIEWLKKHKVPYDNVIIGKPWCGHNGFYVDDKAIRPSEFVNLSNDEIIKIIKGK